MTRRTTTTKAWKVRSERIENIPVTYSAVPTTPPSSEGKFFRTWASGEYCVKWPKSNVLTKPYGGIPEIAAISLVLEAAALAPPLLSVIYDPMQRIAGLCVKQVEILEKCDTRSACFLQFQRELRSTAEAWHLRRHPYEELDGVDSFVLEAKGRRNVGKMNRRLVLVDIDPKCWTDNRRVNWLKLSIERAVRTLADYE